MDLPSETTKRYKYADVLYSIIKMFKLKMADNLKRVWCNNIFKYD